MNDSLSLTQRLVLLKLLFTSETPLQSEVRPALSPKQRGELENLGLIRLEPRAQRRGKQVILTDKAWNWASENLESKLVPSKHATPALEAILRRLNGFLRAHSLKLSDFFEEPVRVQPSPEPPQVSVEEQIRHAYLGLSEGRFSQMIRLADLKLALPDIPIQAVDEALLTMQRKGEVSLQTIESMRQTTEEDRQAAIRVLGEDRNLVYLEK